MVGRFESGELRREAAAHEALTARQGLAGKCWCLLCTFIVAVGLRSVFSGSPSSVAARDIPELEVVRRSSTSRAWGTPSAVSTSTEAPSPSPLPTPPEPEYGADDDTDFTDQAPLREEVNHLNLDFSLMAVLLTVLTLCLAPSLMRVCGSPPWNPVSGGYNPWVGPDGYQRGPDGLFCANQAAPGTLLGSNCGYSRDAYGRLVDVKPGEFQGGAGAGMFGGTMDRGTGMDWTRGASGMLGSWSSMGAPGMTPNGSSWWNPSPSQTPYSNMGMPSNMGTPGLSGAWPPVGGWNMGNGNFGQPVGMPGSNMPNEAEVTETYASFGSDMQQWVPRLMSTIQKELIEPLIQEIEESDRTFQQALSARGWRLTDQAPRQQFAGLGAQGSQEVSVYDRYLPQQLNDPRASQLWERRQLAETYLQHPTFTQEQRAYVLNRLREWRDRGLANMMRAEWRHHDQLPTDAHVLENLVIKMLNSSMGDFDKCFLVNTMHGQPMQKHLGQAPVAYLRQVTDQSVMPKPAPHYEVITQTKVWKLRPGNRNLLEALSLLIHILRRQNSRSFESFPPAIRNAVEPSTFGAIANLPSKILSWLG